MNFPKEVAGKVIRGDQIGRTIGFPTANLDVQLDPAEIEPGVYVGQCQVGDQTYFCLPYFGPRAVMGETHNIFEVYIYDFDQQIYDQLLAVTLLSFVRAPININSLEELKSQLERDKASGLQMLPNKAE